MNPVNFLKTTYCKVANFFKFSYLPLVKLEAEKHLNGEYSMCIDSNGEGALFNRLHYYFSKPENETDRKNRNLTVSEEILPWNGELITENTDLLTGVQIKEINGFRFVEICKTDDTGRPLCNYRFIEKDAIEFAKELWNGIEKDVKKTKLPENGIYKIRTVRTMFGTQYVYEPAEIPQNPVVCKQIDKITNDVDFFFNNIPLFSRFKQSPSRKIMMVGEPGTGKTSICYKIAEKFEKDAIVVYVKDFEQIMQHTEQCAMDNRKTIIVVEDADNVLDGNMLNFLDGIDRPNIPNGLVMLFTSNHPEKIEKRITKRPGRIDKIYKVGNITDADDLLKVFSIYFDEYFTEADIEEHADQIVKLFKGCTGAQIKEISNNVMQYVVSNNLEGVTFDVIEETKRELFEAYGLVDSDAQESIDQYNYSKYRETIKADYLKEVLDDNLF